MIFGHMIVGRWGPRREKLDEAAEKMARMFAAWAKLDPALAEWKLGRSQVPLAGLDRQGMANLLIAGQSRDEVDDTPVPDYGLGLIAWNGKNDAASAMMQSRVGGYVAGNFATNYIDLHFRPLAKENEHVLTLQVFKPALLTIAEIWEPTWCSATHFNLVGVIKPIPGRKAPSYLGGWLTYVGPRFASLIKPPPSAITEHPPGGGVLMTATEERFDLGNPKHIAVARDINAALAPLNALPWPPDNDVRPGKVV